jgi:ATP-dependent RNA helicase DDX18/HAS1
MLFSATQTKKVEDLVNLSLSSKPVYVGVHDESTVATVQGLEQGYVVCPSDTRFLLLFTFLKRNKKKKVIVFMSSCAAVKYYGELLNYIDIPVLDLHVRGASFPPFVTCFDCGGLVGQAEATKANEHLLRVLQR